jgi:DNA adenine methylase
VIYCDPPYRNTKEYNNRIKFDSDGFFEFARKLSENNIVLISEQSAPDDFECIWKQSVKRQIDTSNKFDVCEKLFIYKNGKQIKIPTKRGLF